MSTPHRPPPPPPETPIPNPAVTPEERFDRIFGDREIHLREGVEENWRLLPRIEPQARRPKGTIAWAFLAIAVLLILLIIASN